MPATVYLVTGGCRSGKSSYAESICTQLCPNPIYVATAAHPKLMNGTDNEEDDDFAQRIERHQKDRASPTKNWTTIEEPILPSRYANQFSGKAVLVDCLTVWLTNYMVEEGVFGDDDNERMGTANNEEAEEDLNTKSNNNNSQDTTPVVQPSTSRTTRQQQKQQTLACDRALTNLQQEFKTLIQPYDVTFVFVTNEVGSSTHPATHLARKFVDYQGWLNQFVAKHAQQVIHMVCGQPCLIKNELGGGVGGPPQQHQLPSTTTTQAILLAQRLDRHLSTRRMPMDSKGYFMITTDPIQCLIIASFHSCILNELGEVCDLEGNKISCNDSGCSSSRPEPMKVWHCRTAKELTTEIFERWEFLDKVGFSVGHAAYIGREAERAEHSLYKSGLKYQQD
jgi:adenosylcobinamide kinase / adenosylcobinamide-phosphate guanylyltransferase